MYRIRKKLASLAIALLAFSTQPSMLMASNITASGSTGISEGTLEQTATNFSVTVPVVLPVMVDADGNVIVSNNAKIVNNSFGPVEIKNIKTTAVNGWNQVQIPSRKINSKEFNINVVTDQNVIEGGGVSTNVTYNVAIAPQKDMITANNIAETIFTIGWYEADNGVNPPTPDPSPTPNPITDFKYTVQTNMAYVTDYIGTVTDVVVPSTIEGKPVVLEAARNSDPNFGVFRNNKNITSVRFEDGVTILGNDMQFMFSGCSSLVSVYSLPDNVKNMQGAFANCTSLINVPSIPSSVNTLQETFYGCTSLVSAPDISNGVKNMTSTFSGCTSLVNVQKIPNSVTDMTGTFADCTSIKVAPKLSDSLNSLGMTFKNCTALISMPEIPSSVSTMLEAFSGCTSLVNTTEIPASVTSMKGTYFGCVSLVTAPIIGANVIDMTNTFAGCTSLTTPPIIPDKVNTMYYTFRNCSELIAAPAIPNSVSDLQLTFEGCVKLVTPPEIPSSVVKFNGTFQNCYSLSGELIIKTATSNVDSCLKGATTEEGASLTLSGNSVNLNKILLTAGGNSNITIKP